MRSRGVNPNVPRGPYALAASPGALRGGTRRLEGRGGAAGPAEHSSPMSMAMTHFARALGAARSGNPDAAKADIAKLAELRDKLREAKDAYWAEQVDIQWQVATAWLLYAEGKHDDALKAMSAAADAEDKTEKAPGDAGRAEARARALRHHAARARHGARRRSPHSKRRSRRSRTASAPSSAPRRRPSTWAMPPRRGSTSGRRRARRECRSGAAGDRAARAFVQGELRSVGAVRPPVARP